MIDGADLTLYDENGNNFTIGLSNNQLAICLKILGIEMSMDGRSYTMFSDDTLRTFAKMKSNPLRYEAE